MSANDQAHFENYRAQTRAKHEILVKYLWAYFTILKKTNDNLIFLDGFAGPGTYTCAETAETFAGSPLRALESIASSPDLSSRVSTLFIELDRSLADELKTAVSAFHAEHPSIREPIVEVGAFADVMNAVLDRFEKAGIRMAPTFLFVDPCGVAGVDFSAIQRFMQQANCELLLFFNLDGIRRILGLGEEMRGTITSLLGSEDRAEELVAQLERCSTPVKREECIVAFYERLLRREMGTAHVSTFRVEKEDRRVTSHYFMHATRSPLGFKIMKDVMWGVGKTAEGRGGLCLEQASHTDDPLLLTPQWEAVRQAVLAELNEHTRTARHFYEVLTVNANNRLSCRAYREALLELEEEGLIEVLDKTGKELAPASKRRKKKGRPTLGEGYYIRLKA